MSQDLSFETKYCSKCCFSDPSVGLRQQNLCGSIYLVLRACQQHLSVVSILELPRRTKEQCRTTCCPTNANLYASTVQNEKQYTCGHTLRDCVHFDDKRDTFGVKEAPLRSSAAGVCQGDSGYFTKWFSDLLRHRGFRWRGKCRDQRSGKCRDQRRNCSKSKRKCELNRMNHNRLLFVKWSCFLSNASSSVFLLSFNNFSCGPESRCIS